MKKEKVEILMAKGLTKKEAYFFRRYHSHRLKLARVRDSFLEEIKTFSSAQIPSDIRIRESWAKFSKLRKFFKKQESRYRAITKKIGLRYQSLD